MTLMWPWKVKCDFGGIGTVYGYNFTPGAPNWAYFCSTTSGLRVTPYLHQMTLRWPWKVKCDFGGIGTVYGYTFTSGGPNWAYFRCTASGFRDKPHLHWMTLKGQMGFWSHRYCILIHLKPRGPKLSLFLLYGAPFPRYTQFKIMYGNPRAKFKLWKIH